MSASESKDRLFFFDNLRSLMVILVLVLHSAASYGSKVDFWPFHDKNPSGVLDLFMFLCDVFAMAILFFIAGFFSLPSLRKRGAGRFVADKLGRLGLPWLAITTILMPILDYCHYLVARRDGGLPAMDFPGYWLRSMGKIAEFRSGWIDMSSYQYMTDNFYQRYVWFLSLLFLFFAVQAAAFAIRKRFGGPAGSRPRASDKDSERGVARACAVAIASATLLFAFARFFLYPSFMSSSWFSLFNVFQFQLGKLAIYIAFFCLGAYAYSREWFTRVQPFARPWIWAILCVALFCANMLFLKAASAEDAALPYEIGFALAYPLWIFSFAGLFFSWASKRWNEPTAFNRSLAGVSFDMYLVHYIVPFTLPLALRSWDAPTLLKFVVVAAATLSFSYGVGMLVRGIRRALARAGA